MKRAEFLMSMKQVLFQRREALRQTLPPRIQHRLVEGNRCPHG